MGVALTDYDHHSEHDYEYDYDHGYDDGYDGLIQTAGGI